MRKLLPLLILPLILLSANKASASDYADYVDAKKEYLERDRDYLDYLNYKKKYAEESAAGLAEYRRLKGWDAYRAEKKRRRYIYLRDKRDRMPASIQHADEMQYDKNRAAELAEIERDRIKHIRLRDIRAKARNEVLAYPVSDSVYKRNLEPWNE
ncbi:MAG: hypothetical protein ABL958_17235 [Bdellovibrionia bacterium]